MGVTAFRLSLTKKEGGMMKHHVFVYGTLRQHESNHHLLKTAKCIAQHL